MKILFTTQLLPYPPHTGGTYKTFAILKLLAKKHKIQVVTFHDKKGGRKDAKRLEEILRIKAYLIVKRNATRDFIDFIALFDNLGTSQSVKALSTLDACYPQKSEASMLQQLTVQLAEPKPWDLTETDLKNYKKLKAEYADWKEITKRARAAAQSILKE